MAPAATYERLSYNDLTGWAADDHQAALDVFRSTADLLDPAIWPDGIGQTDARRFFETGFVPVVITDGKPAHFTGYYEPELQGALTRTGSYRYPLYAVPDDFSAQKPYLTRRVIEQDNALSDRGLEIAWLADPVDLFFLQVQGSGRIILPDGNRLRVGFAAKNGHPYRSIGKILVERGIFDPAAITADKLARWLRANPDAGRDLMWENDSYVFFKPLDTPADQGPLGVMGRPVTAGRTIAVDPAFLTYGTPVWVEKTGAIPLQRLMVAQDTGSAIKGAQRADIFIGTGDVAGQQAGAINNSGRMVALMPHALADSLLQGAA